MVRKKSSIIIFPTQIFLLFDLVVFLYYCEWFQNGENKYK